LFVIFKPARGYDEKMNHPRGMRRFNQSRIFLFPRQISEILNQNTSSYPINAFYFFT